MGTVVPSEGGSESAGPIDGVRVLEVGGGLAAAYAVKLLVDLGAQATIVEPPGGCALRGSADHGPLGAPLCQHLRAGCASLVLDLGSSSGPAALHARLDDADVAVVSLPLGRWTALARGRPSRAPRPAVTVHVSAFGRTGPRAELDAPGAILQAMAGWARRLTEPGERPLLAGGDLHEYSAGVHAAVAALTAWRHAVATGSAVDVDVSEFECLVGMLPYPTLHAEILEAAGSTSPPLTRVLPGVMRAADGWVGINPLNQQGWNDLCEVMGLAEHRDRLRATLADAELAEAFRDRASAWVRERPWEEVVDLMQAIRVPATHVVDGRGLLEHPQLRARGALVHHPGGFTRPRAPWRCSASPVIEPGPAPALGADSPTRPPTARPNHTHRGGAVSSWGGGRSGLPFSGLRVLDLSTYWAGPLMTMYLGAFGADVVKVESHRRPDPFRYSTSSPELGRDWWERSAVWQGTNRAKRGLTLDLTRPEGGQLLGRFVGQADVLVESFTPRVLAQLGVDPAQALAENPRLIVVRMPAFGLDGPWRDHVAWAPTFEQACGLAHVTGDPDGPPTPPGGCADPISGMHGLVGLLAALEHRDRTGEGQVVEMAQLEALVNVTASQVVATSAGAEPPTRLGNRHPLLAPHGVYPCRGADEWLAVVAADDREWQALGRVLHDAGRLPAGSWTDVADRRARHDELDAAITGWTAVLSVTEAETELRRAGISAGAVADAARLRDDDQLRARQFFQPVERPVSGTFHHPGWPMTFSFGPGATHEHPAPTLGQHTTELLRDVLGLSDAEIARLRRDDVIGDRPPA